MREARVFVLAILFGICGANGAEENELLIGELRRLSSITCATDPNDQQSLWDYFITEAKKNAISLALRKPNSNLSHAVYASIVEDRIDDEAMKGALLKQKKQRLDSLEETQVKSYNKKREERWNDALRPLVEPILVENEELAFIRPSCADVETDLNIAQGRQIHSVISERTNDAAVVFMGVTLGMPIGPGRLKILERYENGLFCKAPFKLHGRDLLAIELEKDMRVKSVSLMYSGSGKDQFVKDVKWSFEYVFNRFMHEGMAFHFRQSKVRKMLRWEHSIVLSRKGALYSIEIEQRQRVKLNKLEYSTCLTVSTSKRDDTFPEEIRSEIAKVKNESKEKKSVSDSQKGYIKQKESETISALEVDAFKRKVKSWRMRNFYNRSLSQYKSTEQIERRRQFEELQMLLAEVAVAYTGEFDESLYKAMIRQVNYYYSSDSAAFWSRQGRSEVMAFNNMIAEATKRMGEIVTLKGDRINYKRRADRLYLQACHGVDTWDELAAMRAAEKAAEEKREKERAFWQEERRIQAEREKADAIRNQTIDVYHHW